MAVIQTKIPQTELEIFSKLKDIKVVFDVGARTDTDYFDIFPEAEYHLFEPNSEFFEELKAKVGDRKNVYLNNFGLGDKEGEISYNPVLQAFSEGEAWRGDGPSLLVKTLDWYVKEHNIQRIDFLKIDAEGYDYKVLLGGTEAVKLCRYIQYEHWNNLQKFHDLLNYDFWMKYIGYRNVLCKRDDL